MADSPAKPAPNGPGLPPRWTRGAKEAVGTAYSASSRVWYTLSKGIVNEVYFPTIDTPQLRDLQFLVTDGRTFFHDERRNTRSTIACIDRTALGFEIKNVAENGLYTIEKTIIGHPHQDCLLMRTRFTAAADVLTTLRAFLLCAPHLEIGGWHNNAEVLNTRNGRVLVAFKGATWIALGATVPLPHTSCGYVAVNDGWTDLHDNFSLDWEYDAAYDGNIALTAEVDLHAGTDFVVGLAFGDTRHRAMTNLLQSFATPFEDALQHFVDEWGRPSRHYGVPRPPSDPSHSLLHELSVNLLLAHEDKSYPGAMIAALSIPWGSSKGDDELGGYHLVWTRDLVQAATALFAAGDRATPLRVLVYLAVSQREDGGFYQNFWIDGRPYWSGVQLDEVSFPIILVWKLMEAGACGRFDPMPMVKGACGFLIREGPATAQERWEEAGGYSPSTLAINIAALVAAAALFDRTGEAATATFVREYADFLEAHIERWTVTDAGTLVPGVSRHYVRINPNVTGDERVDGAMLNLSNQPPGGPYAFPAKDIVDAGFLELVRYGIRRADDPLIVDSVRVVDAILKVDTPHGPCWKRYNHDGYGQHADGRACLGWGVGRPWPLLTGERGHYELAAGRDARPYMQTLERFAVGVGLLPEQIWDQDPIPDKLLTPGGPTGSAIPLVWAHAEYLKLVRSIDDGHVFDRIEAVETRYTGKTRTVSPPLEIWSRRRQFASMPRGSRVRVIAASAFTLRWTHGDAGQWTEVAARDTGLAVWFADTGSVTETLRFSVHGAGADEEHVVTLT